MPTMVSQYYRLQPGSFFVRLVVFHMLENSSCCPQRFLFSVSFNCSQQSTFRLFTLLVTLCQLQPSLSLPSCPMWVNPLRSSQGLFGRPGGSAVKNSPASAGDIGSIPGSRTSPGEGKGNPLQYSCLENPMHRAAWQATVHGIVSKSWTQFNNSIARDYFLLDLNYISILVV